MTVNGVMVRGKRCAKLLSFSVLLPGIILAAEGDRNRDAEKRPASGKIVWNFETGDLQGWKVVSGRFAKPVTDRAEEHHGKRPYVKEGKWFLSTLENAKNRPDDSQTGVIESPSFKLLSADISFMIGGGKGASFQLVDRATDKPIVKATGANAQALKRRKWHVPGAVGKTVFFRVEDMGTAGWCHVTVDDISCKGEILADDLARRLAERAARRRAAEEAVRREVLPHIKNEIVYTCRPQYPRDHHNTATIFQCGEINESKYRMQGSLKAWDPVTRRKRVIVPELPGRTIRDPEVSYDGRTIVFSMREGRKGDYHIWTVNADGTGLKQLTRAKGVSDIDPEWLPDGSIVFSSTREPKYCMCNRHIMANLYRMEGDGANIHQIGRSTLFEGHSSVLSDGRILYDRWEYVDRNFGDAQGLWTCNPDGTSHAIWWGNNTTSPGGVISARQIPGEPTKVIAVLTACHDLPWGALGIIDRAKGVDGPEPVLRTWPSDFRGHIHVEGENFDSTRRLRVKYADPFPLDARRFLCVRQTEKPWVLSVCYVDLDGREVELFRDGPGCHSPILLAPRVKPPVIPVRRNYTAPHAPGTFYVQNVYVGTHMKGVRPGSIKALRIVESPEKRNWTGPSGWFGHGEEAACMNWHSFENKRILGTVPVEADGSAYFEVPANTFVYFQALDAEGKMVQSMRSGTYVQPGERYGCVGCHESRVGEVPPVAERPLAMRRAATKMNGWYGPARLYSFQKEVQGVFTKHCTSCHDYGKDAGKKLNLSGDRGAFFSTGYVDLWALGYVTCAGGGRAEIYPAYSWGAHASRLTKKLYGHGGCKLTDEELSRVITWMDINGPYYPMYETAYSLNPGGRMPISFDEKKRLEKITGVKIENNHAKKQREQLNFNRPECSRILDGVTDPAVRAEALEIIRAGAARLKEVPRGDVTEGFRACEADRKREERYLMREAEEKRVYSAIREGRKVYD